MQVLVVVGSNFQWHCGTDKARREVAPLEQGTGVQYDIVGGCFGAWVFGVNRWKYEVVALRGQLSDRQHVKHVAQQAKGK